MCVARDNQVHISEECRERVLNSDVIKIDIFEEARVEMLKAIQVGSTGISDLTEIRAIVQPVN